MKLGNAEMLEGKPALGMCKVDSQHVVSVRLIQYGMIVTRCCSALMSQFLAKQNCTVHKLETKQSIANTEHVPAHKSDGTLSLCESNDKKDMSNNANLFVSSLVLYVRTHGSKRIKWQ